MTDMSINADVLRRALDGDSDAQREARALLRTARPTTGLLGRWAKHPEHGDVLITDDNARPDGLVIVAYLTERWKSGSGKEWVCLDDLTFPHQVTRPEDVPPGEAWLVEIDGKRLHAIKYQGGDWIVGEPFSIWRSSSAVTLISPLVPVRPTGDDHTPKTPAPQTGHGKRTNDGRADE